MYCFLVFFIYRLYLCDIRKNQWKNFWFYSIRKIRLDSLSIFRLIRICDETSFSYFELWPKILSWHKNGCYIVSDKFIFRNFMSWKKAFGHKDYRIAMITKFLLLFYSSMEKITYLIAIFPKEFNWRMKSSWNWENLNEAIYSI